LKRELTDSERLLVLEVNTESLLTDSSIMRRWLLVITVLLAASAGEGLAQLLGLI